jgi:DNA-binding transcriptional MerR regulator
MKGYDTLTHKDLAAMLGVSQTTIKNYRRKFPGMIPQATRGKPIRFKPESADICRTIRDGFEHGLSVDEIKAKLAAEHGAKSVPEPAGSGDSALARVLESLTVRVEELARGQEAVLERLEDFGKQLENQALSDAQAELLAQFQERSDAAEQAAPERASEAWPASDTETASKEAGRFVRIRARDGSYKRYELRHVETEPESQAEPTPGSGTTRREAEPETPTVAATEPEPQDKAAEETGEEPPPEFFTLPMVIRSEKGEFLGVPGRDGRHLSIGNFLELLEQQVRTPGKLPVHWRGEGDAWVMEVKLGKPPYHQDHIMEIEHMTTPRGNRVAWLKSMRIGENEVPESFLATFLKQLRKELTG